MTSYLENGYDVKCFAKFEKFILHSIIIPSFMTVGSQMPLLHGGGGGAFLPPYKTCTQNTPYKLGLSLASIRSYSDREIARSEQVLAY